MDFITGLIDNASRYEKISKKAGWQIVKDMIDDSEFVFSWREMKITRFN